jgi:hypothetical protein
MDVQVQMRLEENWVRAINKDINLIQVAITLHLFYLKCLPAFARRFGNISVELRLLCESKTLLACKMGKVPENFL